jgi:hypothetical protein
MDDMAVGGEDQVGGIGVDTIFDRDIVAIAVPGFDVVGVFGGCIQLNLSLTNLSFIKSPDSFCGKIFADI